MYPNKTLLVITNTPLTPQAYESFGVNTTYKNWKIIYWNILPFVNKKLDQQYSNKAIKLRKDKNHIKINSLYDFFKEYKNLPDKFFYMCGVENIVFISLLDWILNFSGGTKISLQGEGYPSVEIKYFKLLKDLLVYDKIYLLKKILPVLFSKIIIFSSRINLQPKPDIFFVQNQKSYLITKKKFKNKKIFKVNNDLIKMINKSKRNTKNNNKIVFVDQGFENIFDTKLNFFVKKTKLEKNYWDIINKLLNFVPKKINNNGLVIAAHRRRSRLDTPSNKKFMFDKTYQLIKESKLVFGHESTALRLAVLSRKPIIFINLYLFKVYLRSVYLIINELAKELGSNIIYIDKNLKFKGKIKLNKINEKKYKKFEEYYIGFPGLKSYGKSKWKTILKHLEKELIEI